VPWTVPSSAWTSFIIEVKAKKPVPQLPFQVPAICGNGEAGAVGPWPPQAATQRANTRTLPRAAGDMRCLPFAAASFDWVLNFFTSFGYFEKERENFQVLEEIVRVLVPGGRFLIDIMNSANTLRHLQAREVQRIDGRAHEAHANDRGGKRRPAKTTRSMARAAETQTVEIERWYDAATKRINKRIRVQAPGGGGTPRTFLESVRAYQPEEVTIGLHWAGLEVSGLYGNFQGDLYSGDSERLILVGWKPA